jgi:hypothetical protein
MKPRAVSSSYTTSAEYPLVTQVKRAVRSNLGGHAAGDLGLEPFDVARQFHHLATPTCKIVLRRDTLVLARTGVVILVAPGLLGS